MKQAVNHLENFTYDLDEASVLNFMGYADPAKARKPILKIMREQLQHVPEWTQPWGQAIEIPLCGINGDEILLKKGVEQVTLKSEQLPRILRKADAVTILLVTAGSRVNEASRKLMADGKQGQALAVDAIGSAMVVDLMKALTDKVFNEASERGYGTTLRVGPGYTGWHFDDQGTLFSFYDDYDIPVDMSDGIMMSPKKSLLGMVGLTPGGKAAPEIEPCRICDLKNCAMRKAPYRGFSKD